jgi:hypothetical protein
MKRNSDTGGRLVRTGSADGRLAALAGRGRLGALALLLPLTLLCAPAAVADDASDGEATADTAYIINLDRLQPSGGADMGFPEAGPGFSAGPSPTGVYLPDASVYFVDEGGDSEFTYVTPRVQGIQVSWTADRNAAAGPNDGTGSRSYESHPTSVGASFAQGGDDLEISMGGDYGRASKSVPGMVRLVDDQELLRLGAHARIHEFTVGGAVGSDIEPGNIGQTLSWDAFGRYDFGALAVGFVYNYTIESDSPSGDGGGMPGTLQGGVSYFFTPRMAISTNLAYGSYVDQSGGDDSAIAGVLGFSLDF